MKYTKFSFILCIVFLFITKCYSAVYFKSDSENPDRPGFCHFKETSGSEKISMYLKPGEVKRHPKSCIKITCNDDFLLSFIGCGVAEGPSHCRYTHADPSRPFPHCCPELIC